MNKLLKEGEFEPTINRFNENKETINTISYLSDVYQIFIDYLI